MSQHAFHPHHHEHCVNDALHSAEVLCAERGVRLTPIRKRVLELVWASHKPLGAYAILEKLTDEGHKPAPPTVYRALEFLLEQGLIHRIASSPSASFGISTNAKPLDFPVSWSVITFAESTVPYS